MRMLSLVAEQQLFLPSQVIINKGDIGQHMYIITRGEAEVLYTHTHTEHTMLDIISFHRLFLEMGRLWLS